MGAHDKHLQLVKSEKWLNLTPLYFNDLNGESEDSDLEYMFEDATDSDEGYSDDSENETDDIMYTACVNVPPIPLPSGPPLEPVSSPLNEIPPPPILSSPLHNLQYMSDNKIDSDETNTLDENDDIMLGIYGDVPSIPLRNTPHLQPVSLPLSEIPPPPSILSSSLHEIPPVAFLSSSLFETIPRSPSIFSLEVPSPPSLSPYEPLPSTSQTIIDGDTCNYL